MMKDVIQRALAVLPGGVNSPVRSFKNVDCSPLVIDRANGVTLKDADNNNYLDFCLSWGVMILGHSPSVIIEAIESALLKGTSFGCTCEAEVLLAEKIVQHVSSIEKVRFVNSGTEATMSAARLARGYTKRDLIVKFTGCYHGHADYFLVEAGSGLADSYSSSSKGVTMNSVKDVISLPYNDIDAIKKVFLKH